MQILEIHTAKMREHRLLAPDVDLADLAVQTKNFTGAEIEGLVRAAQSTAMNRFIQVIQIEARVYRHVSFCTKYLTCDHKNSKLTIKCYRHRPFPSSLDLGLQNESSWKTFRLPENEIDLHDNEPVGRHIFTRSLVFIQRQKA